MDTAIHSVPHRAPDPVRLVPSAQSLTVTGTDHLSETGRNASLLAGGDGRARQRLSVPVPSTRLHLVAVDVNGVARLRLQPRFELTDSERVVRHDGPPTYDAPPSVEDLFRDAARNLELERTHRTERMVVKERQRDADRDRRSQVARAFLADLNQRAMPHPRPLPTRCYLATADGRLLFDAADDVGVARELPQEAFRRFRSDLQRRKERNLQQRAAQSALHAEKRRLIGEWARSGGDAWVYGSGEGGDWGADSGADASGRGMRRGGRWGRRLAAFHLKPSRGGGAADSAVVAVTVALHTPDH